MPLGMHTSVPLALADSQAQLLDNEYVLWTVMHM